MSENFQVSMDLSMDLEVPQNALVLRLVGSVKYIFIASVNLGKTFMSNIASVFIRIYSRKNQKFTPSQPETFLLEFLQDEKSYCVKEYSALRLDGTCIDLQYGAKSSHGDSPSKFWEVHQKELDSVWIRDYNDGGDLDSISYLSHEKTEEEYLGDAEYGFDEIRVLWLAEDIPPQGKNWKWHRQGDFWALPFQGLYGAGNERTYLAEKSGSPPSLNSPTTPVHARESGEYHFSLNFIPFELRNLEEFFSLYAQQVDFFWQGRLVHRQLRGEENWFCYFLDDWDNCVNSSYLSYNNQSLWISEQMKKQTVFERQNSPKMDPNLIPVTCSQGHSFTVPQIYAGSKRRCPICGEKIDVQRH